MEEGEIRGQRAEGRVWEEGEARELRGEIWEEGETTRINGGN